MSKRDTFLRSFVSFAKATRFREAALSSPPQFAELRLDRFDSKPVRRLLRSATGDSTASPASLDERLDGGREPWDASASVFTTSTTSVIALPAFPSEEGEARPLPLLRVAPTM
eukprot:CAMPEP_0178392144 /NCGR_PEP_ID=MMETSP0689_2-20121128/11527_1 /TAXON_ID=160604 /ORGANISM="Amphidinium massartii, Strain CS-259" /LENGTH=112 /DNA_ID=CAMNT_0020012709 /DNA_START=172 /DNA_END=510 /DNA_ORIENTATION=-